MKKTVLIIAGIGILGTLGYFYLRNKGNQPKTADRPTGSTAPTPRVLSSTCKKYLNRFVRTTSGPDKGKVYYIAVGIVDPKSCRKIHWASNEAKSLSGVSDANAVWDNSVVISESELAKLG